jgi:hypothetical protein
VADISYEEASRRKKLTVGLIPHFAIKVGMIGGVPSEWPSVAVHLEEMLVEETCIRK